MTTSAKNHNAFPPPNLRQNAVASCADADFLGVRADVHVLADGSRVCSERGLLRALGAGPRSCPSGRFVRRLAVAEAAPGALPLIEFFTRGKIVRGYPVTALADVAAAITDLALQGTLPHVHRHLVPRARQIERALPPGELLALVDAATGREAPGVPDGLAAKRREYLLDVPAKWIKRYPGEFYRLLARLYGVTLRNSSERPKFFAWFTRRFVYDAIDPDVARALHALEENPRRGHNQHQHLTPRALEVLRTHLVRLMSVLRQSMSPDDFHCRFGVEFRGEALQLPLSFR